MTAFITSSLGKFNEAKQVIFDLEHQQVDLNEIQALSPKQITGFKMEEAKKHLPGKKIIVEDVSLFIDGWNNLPGPLVKWFLKAIGESGIYEWTKKLACSEAKALCTLAYFDGTETLFFEGFVLGSIVEPEGTHGFGWDKIFKPHSSHKTFAQMEEKEKISFSMRTIAFKKLKDYLEKKV